MKYNFEPVALLRSATPDSKIAKPSYVPTAPFKNRKIQQLAQLKIKSNYDLGATPTKTSYSNKNTSIRALGCDVVDQSLTGACYNHRNSYMSQKNALLDSNVDASDDDTISVSNDDLDIFDEEWYSVPKNRIVSPISDIDVTSYDCGLKDPSLSIDDCANRTYNSEQTLINGLRLEIQHIINSEIQEKSGDKFTQSNDQYLNAKKYIPQHRNSNIITKPLLKYSNDQLNLLVISSRGSIDDATIFATEVNSFSKFNENNKNDQALPVITNEWQKITIPVITSLEDRKNMIKRKYHIEDEDEMEYFNSYNLQEGNFMKIESELEIETETETETAIIRGHRFENKTCNNTFTKSQKSKHVSWSH